MAVVRPFFDTNVLLYLLSADEAKADRAEALIGGGGNINVQVLNEFASVALRKLRMSHAEILETLTPIRALCRVESVTTETHDAGLRIAERYGLDIYDALIAAAALEAGCDVLYSEDMQHGQVIDKQLTVQNPFATERGT